MRIEVLRNLGRGLPDLAEGQAADVDDETGELLCARGLARQIKAVPTSPVKAVPPPEEPKASTVEKAEEDLKTYKQKKKAEPSE